MIELSLDPVECSVFFSFVRIHCRLPAEAGHALSVVLLKDGQEVAPERQVVEMALPSRRGPGEFTLQGFVDRAAFPDRYAIRVGFRQDHAIVNVRDIIEREREVHAVSMMTDFLSHLAAWCAENPGRRPTLLDIGGRSRSGYRHSAEFHQCDITIADIVPDESVDVVTDIHRMSEDLGRDRFDFAICISVFEHLIMPWKAVLEINKVLKPDAMVMIQTHQTVGLHDIPWDYYRFSDQSWKGLFNGRTGFRIEKTLMSNFQRIVPMHHYSTYDGFEGAGGFLESAVLVRKVGDTDLRWDVALQEVTEGSYPA